MAYSLTSQKNISYEKNWIKYLLMVVGNCQFQILNKVLWYQRFGNLTGNICSSVFFQKYRYLHERNCLWKRFLWIFSLAILDPRINETREIYFCDFIISGKLCGIYICDSNVSTKFCRFFFFFFFFVIDWYFVDNKLRNCV